MGQKVNPHGARVGVIKQWDTRWYADKKTFADKLVEDVKLREYLKAKLFAAGIARIEIERTASQRVVFTIHAARPGLIIGRGGQGIELIKNDLERKLGPGKTAVVNIMEIRNADTNAQLVAESIASQLEKRTSFRRAMRMAIQRAMRGGVKGIKTMVAGRLGGAEIARSEHYHEGSIPLQTLRADIDYGFAEAKTTYGRIGCKVWIYRGQIMTKNASSAAATPPPQPPAPRPQRPPRDRDRAPRPRPAPAPTDF
ncbi:MAG: 30S ribosomal protein S3 [Clostridia bacterium]|nr:30S ribosomal protein S3 [Clostridia bacterium]